MTTKIRGPAHQLSSRNCRGVTSAAGRPRANAPAVHGPPGVVAGPALLTTIAGGYAPGSTRTAPPPPRSASAPCSSSSSPVPAPSPPAPPRTRTPARGPAPSTPASSRGGPGSATNCCSALAGGCTGPVTAAAAVLGCSGTTWARLLALAAGLALLLCASSSATPPRFSACSRRVAARSPPWSSGSPSLLTAPTRPRTRVRSVCARPSPRGAVLLTAAGATVPRKGLAVPRPGRERAPALPRTAPPRGPRPLRPRASAHRPTPVGAGPDGW